jgi:hypothetical protein
MRYIPALLGISVILALAGCAQPSGTGDGSEVATPDRRWESFEQRATEVAQAWQAVPARSGWQDGYVPLQDPTVVGPDVTFTDSTRQAFFAGWYRTQLQPPADKPADGIIRFPDGTLEVPLQSAAEAYQAIDQGDPPPCPGRPPAPLSPTGGPDDPVGSDSSTACIPLTVTAVELGTTLIHTSRGEATVPAWLFTIDELDAQVARVAVAPSAVTPPPEFSAPGQTAGTDLVAAQDIVSIHGAELTYRLGVGTCDENITPLVNGYDDVVVVGGGVTRASGVCTDQLLIEPVTVKLDEPVGARPVLDALTGQVLIVTNG